MSLVLSRCVHPEVLQLPPAVVRPREEQPAEGSRGASCRRTTLYCGKMKKFQIVSRPPAQTFRRFAARDRLGETIRVLESSSKAQTRSHSAANATMLRNC